MPASVDYNGVIWILNANTSNVASDVPGISSKWSLFAPTSMVIARENGDTAYQSMAGIPLVPSLDLQAHDYLYEATGTHPDVIVVRASNGTVYNKHGTMITIAPGVQRHAFDPYTGEYLGWIFEENRTNLLLYSEDMNNAAWAPGSNTAIVTTNTDVAPDGTTTMDTLEDDSASVGLLRRQTVTIADDDTTYTFSVFVKKGTSRYLALWLLFTGGTSRDYICTYDLDTGTLQMSGSFPAIRGTIDNVDGGIYRISVTAANSTEGNTSVQCRIYPAITALGSVDVVKTGTIAVWGAQLEAAVHASSYIPTTGTQVTRLADLSFITGTNFSSWYNPVEGTIVREVAARPNSLYKSGSGEALVTRLTDGTTDNTVSMRAVNDLSAPYLDVVVRTATTIVVDSPSVSYLGGSFIRQSMCYKTDDVVTSVNGGTAHADTAVALPVVNQMDLLRGSGGGYLRRLTYFPRRISNSLLRTLSS